MDRIKWASACSGDPLRIHRVSWQRTGSLMSVGSYGPAMTLMDRVCDDLSVMSPPALSVWGSAHLRSAILAARASGSTSPGQAQEARRIAPQQTRHHPMVRETVLAIASARRAHEDLSLFASSVGLGR